MSIKIVVHCYAVELPQFAQLLRYQMSSLVIHPPKTPYMFEVYHSPDDKATCDVINWFACNTDVRIEYSPFQPPERLFRRAIGRNDAALSSYTDLVWFCDCDYLFGEGCIDGLWKSWNDLEQFASMMFPEKFWTMKTRELGDELIAQNLQGVVGADPSLFTQVWSKRAFGGLQIVPGSLARERGYLDGHRKYMKPLPRPFANFHDDVAYRKSCLRIGPIVPLEVPNLYRLRHSKTTYQGQQHGTVSD